MYYQQIMIDDERNSVNFYAQEIGFLVSMLHKIENETLRQWINFFISYSEQELENANERLKKLREELTACELRQAELQRV